MRQRRQSRSERTITLRGQIQQARVQLSYFARNRCSSVRTELQEDIAGLPRRAMAGFEEQVRARLGEVADEVAAGVDTDLVEVARHVGVPLELPAAERPTVRCRRPS